MGFLPGWFDCLSLMKKLRRQKDVEGEDDTDAPNLFFRLESLQLATDNFSESNRLGHGGFGPVYKGVLPNGQEIAVKKLSMNSRQGMREFTNEVKLLINLQHRNLVTLLGCCPEGVEKMLVYEYLPNRSLDNFLFDKQKSGSLDWSKRFEIVVGIAKGLLYLHEDSSLKIIHRDIKAGNILLDDKLNPKISDFGLARLFPDEDTHLHTLRISGTHGYMAPEYAMHGYLSVKTDVFSFGVLVLEIVSGRKNHDRQLEEESGDLLSYAWKLSEQGKSLQLVDSSLPTWEPEEALTCIQVGLLCVQASMANRPDMHTVCLLLSSDSITLPKPGKPGIQGRRGRWTSRNSAPTASKTNSSADPSSTQTATTKASTDNCLLEDYSINSISISFSTDGR